MATDVPMPKLGLTMVEATIVDWLVPDGAEVVAGQPILAIETDKTETEVVAPASGRLHQLGRPGELHACGERIAVLLDPGEPHETPAREPSLASPAAPFVPASTSHAPAVSVGARRPVSPNARRVAAGLGVDLDAVQGTGPGGRIVSEDVESYAASRPTSGSSVAAPGPSVVRPAPVAPGPTVVASAAARHLADLLGLDLSLVPVDPVERMVTRETVVLHVRERLALAERGSLRAPGAPLLQDPSQVVRLSGMRGTIARRMTASLREMAQLTLTMDADVSSVLADRARRLEMAGSGVPSITDYVLAAAARALVRHPWVNSQVTADGVAYLPEVHLGVAVAVDGGLLVPVLRNAAHRDLAGLAQESARLAASARSATLTPADLEGGTFSVSALGAYGVDAFTPVVNPPNTGILGVGRVRDDVVLRSDGTVGTRARMTLSFTWDHRAFDGVPAAEFVRTIVELLARPEELDTVR